jgi:hypothetical protein
MEEVILRNDFKSACELYESGENVPEWITITTKSRHEIMEEVTIRTFHCLDYIVIIFNSIQSRKEKLFRIYEGFSFDLLCPDVSDFILEEKYCEKFKNMLYDFFSYRPDFDVLSSTLYCYCHVGAIHKIISNKENLSLCIFNSFDLPLCISKMIAEL